MRLKKIEILGFKSFADRTVLEFSDGITGIVGPNGCGKSNIADAFRWVLGEQSAKSMRGTKMPDVIFAGTAHRPALNFAEVTITLSDIGDALPIAFEEVAVTRRLHRSGESEYFINRNSVRLKDVQDLFLDSGIGKNAFSIFEQGKIDQIIQYSPLERRYIFEEAAGILRFLQRKREALRKLEQVDANSTRVKDIHQEVEKQIIVLEQQAAKARLYKENKGQMELLERNLLVAKWDNQQKRINDLAHKEMLQQEKHSQASEQLAQTNTHLLELKQFQNESETALRSKSEVVFKVRSDKEIQTRERQSQQERLKENKVKEQRWDQELKVVSEKRMERQNERFGLQKKQKMIEKEMLEVEAICQKQRSHTQAIEDAVMQLRSQQQGSQQERLKLLQSENQLDSELKQLSIRQETLNERQETLCVRKEALKKQLHSLAIQNKDKKLEMSSAAAAIDDQKKAFHAIEEHYQSVASSIGKEKSSISAISDEISEGKARQKALLRLREDNEGFSAGSKKLLQESSSSKSPLYKMVKGLYELVVPQAGAESPLAAALRPYAHTLVVDTRLHFDAVIDYAKQHQIKDFSLLCLEGLPAPGPAVKPVKGTHALLKSIQEHPLATHFLQHVFLADTFDKAVSLLEKHPGAATWIQDGFFLDSQHVLFCTAVSESNVFLREAELKSLSKKLETLETRRHAHDMALKDQQKILDELQSKKVELDKCIRRDEMKLIEINFDLQRCHSDLEKAQVEDKQVIEDLKNIHITIDSITVKISDLTTRHVLAKATGLEMQQRCLTINSDLEQQTSIMKKERTLLQEKETTLRNTHDENKKLLHALHILEVKDLESQHQEHRLKEEILFSAEFQTQMIQKGDAADKNLNEINLLLHEATAVQESLEKDVTKQKHAIKAVEQQLQVMSKQLTQIEEELYRIRLQKTQVHTVCHNLSTEYQERYNSTIETANSTGIEPLEQIEKQIRALRQEIENAGDINMTSIEEFDKHQTRYEFLNHQLDDLNVSKHDLVQVITQLDNESRHIFKETFNIICENFKKNFKILFNGGEADLQFTESSDVLDAGIEIIAKPPGKQMRSISLLSGGEKCMTAMALLFAIFEFKPAPFCILDEIDAPLDDSNVARFAAVVKQFIDRCQFVIITHNKRTMAIADVLCGVSMEEKGISKLISIEFTKQQSHQNKSFQSYATIT